jgi:hypothetical protein
VKAEGRSPIGKREHNPRGSSEVVGARAQSVGSVQAMDHARRRARSDGRQGLTAALWHFMTN